MDAAALLDGLTPAQRAAVTSTAAPLCVLAGAGSGKTRVLTRRIAYRAAVGSADPTHVLALTFTRQAAGELRTRLAQLGVRAPVAAGTFHGVAFAQLRQWWSDRGVRPPALLDGKGRLLAPLVTAVAGPATRTVVAWVGSEIEWAKARLVGPAGYPSAAAEARRRSVLPAIDVADVFARYEIDKRRRGLVDFDDLLSHCAHAISSDPDLAAAQRWRWQHLFVDEYQDLTPAHHHLLSAWLGDSVDLCAVGDPQQAIYGWNGADPTLLTRFAAHRPTAEVIALADNFRSSPEVLAVARAVLTIAPDAAATAATVGQAMAPSGPVPVVRAYATDAEEAAAVARALRDRHPPGTAWSRLAVLARTNVQLALVADALAAAGVPHRIRGGRPLAHHPALSELLASPGRRPAGALAGDLRLRLAEGPADGEATAARRAGLAALREYLDLDPTGTVAGFGAWLEAAERTYDGVPGDAVVLSSFHRAKGLEWPVVFVVGLEDGLVPLARTAGRPPVSEERRLLYVALTRAQSELHCSWARHRRFGGRAVGRAPSPFLPALVDVIATLAAPQQLTDPGAALRDLRRILNQELSDLADRSDLPDAPAAAHESALLTDLRRWRAAVARAGRIAPSAVLGDRTLAAAAQGRPRCHHDLAALPGLGPICADRWGDALLAVIERHRATEAALTGQKQN